MDSASADVMIEQDCTIELGGRAYTSGGAVLTADYAIGYMSGDMSELTTWHGVRMGRARVVASWRTPRSYVSSRQYQVECHILGKWYTGRTVGGNMIWRGKRKAGQ